MVMYSRMWVPTVNVSVHSGMYKHMYRQACKKVYNAVSVCE